jgi:hypothetical protein
MQRIEVIFSDTATYIKVDSLYYLLLGALLFGA